MAAAWILRNESLLLARPGHPQALHWKKNISRFCWQASLMKMQLILLSCAALLRGNCLGDAVSPSEARLCGEAGSALHILAGRALTWLCHAPVDHATSPKHCGCEQGQPQGVAELLIVKPWHWSK